jgi:hypothetical protein
MSECEEMMEQADIDCVDVDAYCDEDDENGYCSACSGSGEGMIDGSTCAVCGGM